MSKDTKNRHQTRERFEALMELVERQKQELKEAYAIIDKKNGELTLKIAFNRYCFQMFQRVNK